jgi:hypothetical protein
VGFTPLRPHLLLAGRISNRCIGSTRLSSGRRFQPALTAAYIRTARSVPDLRSTPPMKTSLLSRLTVSGLFVCLLSAHAQQSSSTAGSTLSPSSVSSRVNQILAEFTVDDAISYIGGTGFFDFKPIPVNDFSPLNPQLYQTDGPLGVRRNEPSVRFPSGLTLAATWNPDRAHDQGVSMGRDARARGWISIGYQWAVETSNT